MIKSLNVIAYPKDNEDLPIALIIKNAIRRPNPDLINPRAKRKAQIMSQIVLLPNPEIATLVVITPVNAAIVTPKNATAPIGNGAKMNPKIVLTNTANKCHAWSVIPFGTGKNHITTPTAIVIKRLRICLEDILPPFYTYV